MPRSTAGATPRATWPRTRPGVDRDVARLAFPRRRGRHDRRLVRPRRCARCWRRCRPSALAAMKIRERITALVEARLDVARARPRGAAPRAGDPRHAAEPRARGAARLAHRRRMWRARRRHRDRLQPLHQARDPRAASTPRRSRCSSTTRARARPTPAPSCRAGSTGSCGSRRPRPGCSRARRAPAEPVALHRAAALSGGVTDRGMALARSRLLIISRNA